MSKYNKTAFNKCHKKCVPTGQLAHTDSSTVRNASETRNSTGVSHIQLELDGKPLPLAEAVNASQRTVELVRTQYMSGLTGFLNLLDAQRELAQQQDSYAESEGQVVQNLIALNRALGGGWEPPDPDNTPVENAAEVYSAGDSAGSE